MRKYDELSASEKLSIWFDIYKQDKHGFRSNAKNTDLVRYVKGLQARGVFAKELNDLDPDSMHFPDTMDEWFELACEYSGYLTIYDMLDNEFPLPDGRSHMDIFPDEREKAVAEMEWDGTTMQKVLMLVYPGKLQYFENTLRESYYSGY